MNRNHMLKRKMTAGLAVGMAVAVGSVPMAMAANTANTKDSSSSVSKEETVYVNADASGNPQEITVSNWLKNAGSESSVEDQSDLTNIKNVKGDETFSENGDSLTWNTDGSDIYYQGQSNKDLPVSVKFTYFLDGQEMQPQDLVGKSGHLQIKIQYTNNEKKSAKVDGKNHKQNADQYDQIFMFCNPFSYFNHSNHLLSFFHTTHYMQKLTFGQY